MFSPSELREAVKDALLENPNLYDQSGWGDNTCGTPMCIAGWAGIITGNPVPIDDDPFIVPGEWKDRIAEAMNVNPRLFCYAMYWEENLYLDFVLATKNGKARVACRAIDFYTQEEA